MVSVIYQPSNFNHEFNLLVTAASKGLIVAVQSSSAGAEFYLRPVRGHEKFTLKMSVKDFKKAHGDNKHSSLLGEGGTIGLLNDKDHVIAVIARQTPEPFTEPASTKTSAVKDASTEKAAAQAQKPAEAAPEEKAEILSARKLRHHWNKYKEKLDAGDVLTVSGSDLKSVFTLKAYTPSMRTYMWMSLSQMGKSDFNVNIQEGPIGIKDGRKNVAVATLANPEVP